jgi:hypothetical protein
METIPTSFDGTSFATLLFLIFLLTYIIFSLILYYHWRSYAISAQAIAYTLTAYFVSTLSLLAIAGSALLVI